MNSIIITIILFLGSFNVLGAPTMSNEGVTVTRIVDSQSTEYDWTKDWIRSFPIHKSCNNTQYNQLSKGLEEAQLVAAHARDHTLKFGRESDFYVKYFGEAPSGTVIGWFDAVVNADKSEILFRCDDIDGNCKNDGWADDLLHRILHTSVLGENTVDYFADTFKECLELAEKNSTDAINNSASLRYYALDVYAYDIAVPGSGCSGDDSEESTNLLSSTTSTTIAGSECHTHANGEAHCV